VVLADISTVKPGLAIVLLCLLFSVALGNSFGVNEDLYKDYVAEGESQVIPNSTMTAARTKSGATRSEPIFTQEASPLSAWA